MILVILESPFAAPDYSGIQLNIAYARSAMRDCLLRGEAPYASHLLYTQAGVLDDTKPDERALGIEAGLLWGAHAKKTVVYVDRGVSKGMRMGIERAEREGRPIEYRWLIEPEYVPRPAIRPPSDASIPPVVVPVTPPNPRPNKISKKVLFFPRLKR